MCKLACVGTQNNAGLTCRRSCMSFSIGFNFGA